MDSSTDIRSHAHALLDRLTPDRLTAVVQLLEFLAQPTQVVATSTEEAALLQVIGRRLPDNELHRVSELRDRCEWGKLSQAEYQELIDYEEKLEHQRLKRLEALMKLAELKNIDLLTLNRQLMSESQPFNAA
jgi:hypothetical protein